MAGKRCVEFFGADCPLRRNAIDRVRAPRAAPVALANPSERSAR